MLLAHARAELPNEACGLLSGSAADGLATSFHPARNAEASPLRYSVHPEDLVRITFAIDDAGEDLVAIFHSPHALPGGPVAHRPARRDVPRRVLPACQPGRFRTAPPMRALRAWRIRDGEASEVRLELG